MWILSRTGFFSVVQNMELNDGSLLVRARVADDLARLRAVCPALGMTIETPHNDYQFRASVDPEAFGRWIASEAEKINYGNFKSMIDHVFGMDRHDIYARVWSALLALRTVRERKFSSSLAPAQTRPKRKKSAP